MNYIQDSTVIPDRTGIRTLMRSMLTRDQLGSLPKADPMIPGVLARESLAILMGRKDVYKSFVALDWALCLATGTPWNGKPVAMPEGRPHVLYMAAEGGYTFPPRVEAWEQHRGVKVGDNFILMNMAVNLYDGPLIGDFVKVISDNPHLGVGLVVIDTLRRVSAGATENSSDMGVIIDNLTRVRKATRGGSVLVLAHTDQGDNKVRGFTGIEDDADIVWHAKRNGREVDGVGPIKLINTKTKIGRKSPDVSMTPLELQVPSHPGTSLVMPTAGASDAGAGLRRNDADILAVIRELFPDDGATAAEVGQAVKERRCGVEIPSSSLYKSLTRLAGQGRLHRAGQQWKLAGHRGTP